MKITKILVALDGSALAEEILPFIEQIAGPLDLEILLLRVVSLSSLDAMAMARQVGSGDPVIKELDAQGYLEPLVGTLKAKGIRAGARIRLGDPPTEVVAAAKEIGADLIAMTTHGRTGLGRLLFGSVAEAVLRSSPVPVLLWRRREGPASALASEGRQP